MTETTVGLRFTRVSKDLEEGYPGNLNVVAEYYLTNQNEFCYEFKGLCDQMTIVNMTNHAYWNLSGNFKRSVSHHVWISRVNWGVNRNFNWSRITTLMVQTRYMMLASMRPQIPDPEGIAVENTYMDFRAPRELSPSIEIVDGAGRPGIDHAFLIRGFSEDKSIR